MNRTLLVIDGMNWLTRAYHAVPPSRTTSGVPTNAVHGFCQMLLRADREQSPTHLCVVFDAPGRTFRHELFPAYKATRPPRPPELVAQIDLAREAAEAFGCMVYSVPGVEADDVIASLVRQALSEGIAVVIGSSDKDLLQLCTEDVRMLDAKNQLVGPDAVKERWGVPPSRFGDLLALTGDSNDNIPGVEGVGPKTAADLLNTYGSLDAVLESAAQIGGKKGAAIAAGATAVALARRLVTLRDDVPLPQPLVETRRNPEKLRALYERLELAPAPGHTAPTPATQVAPPATPAAEPGKLAFIARIGDVLRWDDKSCSVLLVGGGEPAIRELRRRRDQMVHVTVELSSEGWADFERGKATA